MVGSVKELLEKKVYKKVDDLDLKSKGGSRSLSDRIANRLNFLIGKFGRLSDQNLQKSNKLLNVIDWKKMTQGVENSILKLQGTDAKHSRYNLFTSFRTKGTVWSKTYMFIKREYLLNQRVKSLNIRLKTWKDLMKFIFVDVVRSGWRTFRKIIRHIPIVGTFIHKMLNSAKNLLRKSGESVQSTTLIMGPTAGGLMAYAQIPMFMYGLFKSATRILNSLFVVKLAKKILGVFTQLVKSAVGVARSFMKHLFDVNVVGSLALFISTPRGKYLTGYTAGVVYYGTKRLADDFMARMRRLNGAQGNEGIFDRLGKGILDGAWNIIDSFGRFMRLYDYEALLEQLKSVDGTTFSQVLDSIIQEFTIPKMVWRTSQHAMGTIFGKYSGNILKYAATKIPVAGWLPVAALGGGMLWVVNGLQRWGEIISEISEI